MFIFEGIIFLKIAMKYLKLLFVFVLFSCGGDDEPPTPPTPIDNIAPTVTGRASDYNVKTNEIATFNANINDADGDNSKVKTMWDLDGNGTYDTGWAAHNVPVTHKFTEGGNYFPSVKAKDEKGAITEKDLNLIEVAGNIAPTAQGQANTTNGLVSDVYNFDWSASEDPDANNSDLEARIIPKDGATPTAWTPYGTTISHTFAQGGNYNPTLEVKDKDDGVGTKTLDNLGVLGSVNPINMTTSGPAYAEVGENLIFNINAEESDGRPLTYSVNFGAGWIDSNETINKTYNSTGTHSLETKATTDYNISNTVSPEVNIGPDKAFTKWMTDKADGKKYKFAYVDGILMSVDDFQGMTSNYEGKIEEAPFMHNDSAKYSMSFGKLYNRDDVNKGLQNRIFIADNTGIEWRAHVTTEEEYDKIIDAYGGINAAGDEMKYDGFESNGNNSSRMAMMLGGGYYAPNGFVSFGESGSYMTGTDLGNGKNTRISIYKENDNIGVGESGNENKRYVKFTIEEN